MTTIYETRFGSHLYGTNTPQSDQDFASVFVPSVRDVLINGQKALTGKHSISGGKDVTRHSINSFASGLKKGNATSLEILFSTVSIWTLLKWDRHWLRLWNNRDKFLSSECHSMLGYCKSQAKINKNFLVVFEKEGWKRLSHAVRISNQALEYLHDGMMTFPRPEAETLLKIRNGEIEVSYVEEMLTNNLLDIEEARARSILRKTPDEEFLDNWVLETYKEIDGGRYA